MTHATNVIVTGLLRINYYRAAWNADVV